MTQANELSCLDGILFDWQGFKSSKRWWGAQRRRPGFIYVLESGRGIYKIGRAVNVAARLSAMKSVVPFRFTLLHTFASEDVTLFEAFLHRRLRRQGRRLFGEWYRLSEDDVAALLGITSAH